MDLWTLLRIIRRRWLVVVPTLILTAIGAYFFVSQMTPQYAGTGSLVLVQDDPTAQGEFDGGRLMTAANVIAEVMQSGSSAALPPDIGAYSVEVREPAPLLRVNATGESESAAIATASSVLEAMQEELRMRQEAGDLAIDSRIAANVLAVPARAVPTGEPGETVYSAEGSIMLVRASADEDQSDVNPVSILGMATMSSVAELSGTLEFQAYLSRVGGTASFAVVPDQVGPIIRISAEGSDFRGVQATLQGILDGMNEQLADIQRTSPPETRSRLRVFSPLEVREIPPARSRPLLVLLALGAMATLALAVLVEGLMGRRDGQRHQPDDVERFSPGDEPDLEAVLHPSYASEGPSLHREHEH